MKTIKAVDPKWLAKAYAGILLVYGALVASAEKWEKFGSIVFPDGILPSWPSLIALVLTTNFAVFYFYNRRLFAQTVENAETKAELANAKGLLHEARRLQRTDVISGVPNETKLKEDIDEFFSRRPKTDEAQLILIDLLNFKQINEEHDFLFGDRVLRFLAQAIYQSMRRDEEMYRYGHDESDRELWSHFYRKYPGGDEFVFMLEGAQHDAMGFVVKRLVPKFKELSQRSEKELGVALTFKFHCAIAPIYRNESYSTALRRLAPYFKRIHFDSSKPSLSWFPEDYENRLPKDSFQRTFYVEARKHFNTRNVEQDGGGQPATRSKSK